MKTFDEYQKAVLRTANSTLSREEMLKNFGMSLAGEVGELLNDLKKHLYHGKQLDMDNAKSELGDVLWYVTAMADTLGLKLEDVAEANIEKLKQRYPGGFKELK